MIYHLMLQATIQLLNTWQAKLEDDMVNYIPPDNNPNYRNEQ